jgi:NAD+ diphosphatase
MGQPRFQSLITPPEDVVGIYATWICVGKGTVVVTSSENGLRFPEAVHPRDLGINADHEHFLGLLDGIPLWCACIDEPGNEPTGFNHETLFSIFPQVSEQTWALAGRAVQIAEWDRTHRFCGRCGEATDVAPGERARKCPACGLLCFPRLSPAVITLIERGNEALLARGRTFGANPMYSTLAGFVEPGETLEECVAREIREEVGVEVNDIRYMRSQPWPFPNSLMIGFNAKYESGDIVCDPTEIVDAQWFSHDNLPNIPGKLSIARWLIDEWLSRQT